MSVFLSFFGFVFFGLFGASGGFWDPLGGGQNQPKMQKFGFGRSFLSDLCLFFGLSSNHVFLTFLVSKSVVFLVVFLRPSAGTFVSIFACFARSDYADYTVKTNEKSTFLGLGLFHAFVKTSAFGVRFACISRLEIHVFLEGGNCLRPGCFFINFGTLEVTLGSRTPLGGLPRGIPKNRQISIPHF